MRGSGGGATTPSGAPGRAEATGVEEAVKVVAERDFDAIVIDRRLPDGDGLDLVRTLRRKGSRAAGVTMVVFTAGHDERDRVALLRAGADDYLAKMAEAADLTGLLRRIERLAAMTPAQRAARRRELVRRLRAGEVGDLDPPPPAPPAPPEPP
ncbi:MAG TPA: response regulator [Acidimicrobiales bacterium]